MYRLSRLGNLQCAKALISLKLLPIKDKNLSEGKSIAGSVLDLFYSGKFYLKPQLLMLKFEIFGRFDLPRKSKF